MKNEQRYRLNRLAEKLVTPERYAIRIGKDDMTPTDNPAELIFAPLQKLRHDGKDGVLDAASRRSQLHA